jgi:hypothetical protein
VVVPRKPRKPPSHPPSPRLITATVAVLGCGLAIAACGGSSSKSGTGAAAPSHGRFVAFSQCMRAHGLPNFPDPSAEGGIQLTPGSGINPFSPAFKSAQTACRKLLPGGGPGGGKPSPEAEKQMLAIAVCMRAHGVTGFPDPTTNPPSGPGSFIQAIGRDGVFLLVPKTINVNSPAYRQAAKVCHFG